ncbi:DeoR/GlpR family DNA-binding transcription regulator [Inquilinus limosus]|uniref:DeoR family transcriptional regulator n=1 Tax=Inquilinus limosus TaxID=171674 RepID=A0A211ZIZ5_9PROT|nr:DeoR family transcriptional regulator [Inquilinus limosus]OWJ65239.1 DeoR family transcriptional regulator [Inquilinus limosus]
MNATARQNQIVELVRQEGYVTVEMLAERFQVTPQTIRRDISLLQDRSLLRRFHGGVTAPGSVENFAYSTRQVLCLEEKRRIAQLVARQVPDNASLFLNIGTTTEEVARALLGHRGLRVITNNINVANILYSNASCEVIVAGGVIRARDGGIVGEATLDFVRQFKVDVGIIGISGIDEDGTLLDYDYREVRVARAIIDNSRQVFLVADHTKFGRNAMVRLASIGEVHALFTDRVPPAPFGDAIAATSCQVHVAD